MARRGKSSPASIAAPVVGCGYLLYLFTHAGNSPLLRYPILGVLLLVIVSIGLTALMVVWIRSTHREERILFTGRCAVSPPQAGSSIAFDHGRIPIAKPEMIGFADALRRIDWYQFEKIVALAYRNAGYSVARKGGANPDGGIDMLLRQDGVTIGVQCKQWKTWNIGVKVVREFLGALTDAQLKQGIIITLCGYTSEAKRLADKHGIKLLDERALVGLLEKHGARFDPAVQRLLQDTRKLCPKCEREMVLRTSSKDGNRFWGCSTYPRCHYTMPL